MQIDTPLRVYMGFDKREKIAYDVAEFSIHERASVPVVVTPLRADVLEAEKLLWRTVAIRNGKMWDVVSEAPQATEFAISRFLTPILAKTGWALFCDCDIVCLTDIAELFALADDKYAVMCVKHQYTPKGDIKMDGIANLPYSRKNWTSVMLFNCDHPANQFLTPETVNSLPGRDLHRFCWLKDEEIGELPKAWNCLIGEEGYNINDAKIAHFTLGGPWFQDHVQVPEDQVWLDEHWSYVNAY